MEKSEIRIYHTEKHEMKSNKMNLITVYEKKLNEMKLNENNSYVSLIGNT